MGLALLWFLSLMVYLSLGSSAPDEDVPNYKSPCADGWTQVGRHCFSVNELAATAAEIAETCNKSDATAATIRGMEQNKILKGIVKEPTWINAKYISSSGWVDPVTFQPLNFSDPETEISGSRIYKCGLLTPNSTWDLDDCRSSPHPTLCQRSLECVDGWYGETCMERCHCFTPGCNITGACPHGCEVGWTGPACNIRQKTPTARYHCMRDGEEYHMILRVDNYGIYFRSVSALDSNGNASSECTGSQFTGNDPMLTYLHGNSTQFSPDCSAQKVDENDPVYEWTFRFQQYEGVLSPFDTDVKVRCNFSDADEMVISTAPIHVERNTPPPEVVTPRHVSASVMIVDAQSGEEISQVAFGQEIKLVVPTAAQNESEDRSRIGLLSPRNCEAKSPDGQFVKKITDSDGCDVYSQTGGGFTLKGSEGEERRMSSQAFNAFAFSGYSSLTFSCDLTPCYNPINDNCVSPCRRNRYGRSAGSGP